MADLFVNCGRQSSVVLTAPSGPYFLQFEHDGIDLDNFTLSIDGAESSLGLPAPLAGTTYRVTLPPAAVGTHSFMVYAAHAGQRTASTAAVLTY